MVKAEDVIGVILCLLMLIVCIVSGIVIFHYRGMTSLCEAQQSPYCFTIKCPCDTGGACNGYASRPGPEPDTYYCSSSPNLLVDSTGNPVTPS